MIVGKWEIFNKTDSINSQLIFSKDKSVIIQNVVNGDTLDLTKATYSFSQNKTDLIFQIDSIHMAVIFRIMELTNTSLVLKKDGQDSVIRYVHYY